MWLLSVCFLQLLIVSSPPLLRNWTEKHIQTYNPYMDFCTKFKSLEPQPLLNQTRGNHQTGVRGQHYFLVIVGNEPSCLLTHSTSDLMFSF